MVLASAAILYLSILFQRGFLPGLSAGRTLRQERLLFRWLRLAVRERSGSRCIQYTVSNKKLFSEPTLFLVFLHIPVSLSKAMQSCIYDCCHSSTFLLSYNLCCSHVLLLYFQALPEAHTPFHLSFLSWAFTYMHSSPSPFSSLQFLLYIFTLASCFNFHPVYISFLSFISYLSSF